MADELLCLFGSTYNKALLEVVSEQEAMGVWRPVLCNTGISQKFDELELSYLWESEEKRNRIISYLVALGTDSLFERKPEIASVIAISVRCLEEINHFDTNCLDKEPHDIESFRTWLFSFSPRFLNDLISDTERKTTKFFSSRTGCSCLKEHYATLKQEGAKKGICEGCFEVKNRTDLLACSRCTSFDYCNEDCQVSSLCSTV
jgi:hypothetical protein